MCAVTKTKKQQNKKTKKTYVLLIPAHGQGAFRDRHDTRAGWRWTWSASARRQSQGGFCPCAIWWRAHDRCGPRTAFACGPVARGSGVKACGCEAARPGALTYQPQDD